jgi:probable rRNA maturation factor
VATQRAEEFGNSFINELILYSMHGMLHLFGYDDKSSDDQLAMTKAEQRVMQHIMSKYKLSGIYAL